MQLSICPQPLYSMDLDQVLKNICALDLHAMELPVDARSPLVNLDELLSGGTDALMTQLQAAQIKISAISIHQEGQLLLGPHHADTDTIFAGSADEKCAYAKERLLKAAELASRMEAPVVVGFVGCEDFSRFFPWPDAGAWEAMLPRFRELMLPILDDYEKLGVLFAQEPHPKQIVFNTETAIESLEVLDEHPAWAFNLDPANLLFAGVDPVVFAQALAGRIAHVHAKDAELVPHNMRRSGYMAHGAWGRVDRGFRFRIPGWGDVPWKRLITELVLTNYDGFLAIEHEDPVFGALDGLSKAIQELRPLLPLGDLEERWL
jgi:sugar phosphate isomerase/epimerase